MGVDDDQIIACEKGFFGRQSQPIGQRRRAFHARAGPGGKVEDEQVAAALDLERSTRALEGNGRPLGFEEVKHDKGGRQRRVSAEVDLYSGRKPANGIGAVCADDKRRL